LPWSPGFFKFSAGLSLIPQTRKKPMSVLRRLTLVAVFLLIAQVHAGQTFTSQGPLRYYAVTRAAAPIAVDGSLGEFAWQTAEQINGFERILNDYDQVLHPTRARMLWDDENLYFAFACQDPDIWAIYDQEDDPMWSEEVVEVFIDPDGDGENYLELEVNPLNAVVDLKIYRLQPEWKSSIPWDIAGLQTAVQVQGTVNDSLGQDLGWTVEIAIPWAATADSIDGGGKPQVGDTWRLNLYRIERRAGRNLRSRIAERREEIRKLGQESGVDEVEKMSAKQREKLEKLQAELDPLQEHYHRQTEYTAWSETFQRGFHHPARFGVVQFVE